MTTRADLIGQLDSEKFRQMRERGSIKSVLQATPIDIFLERVSEALFLATPGTLAGTRYLRECLSHQSERVAFCNGIVLRHRDFSRLVSDKPNHICLRVENYMDEHDLTDFATAWEIIN